MSAVNTDSVISGPEGAQGMVRRVASNLGWSVISEFIGKGFFFLVTIYLARRLGVEKYGIFTYAQTIVTYVWLGAELGIDLYGSREMARDRDRAEGVFRALFTIRLAAGLVIFMIFIPCVAALAGTGVELWVYVGCGFFLLTRAVSTEWAFRGLQQFKYIAIGSLSTFVTMLVLMLVFVRSGADINRAAFIWSLSYALGGAVLLTVLGSRVKIRYRPVFVLSEWMAHLRESIHFTLSGALLSLYQYMPILLMGVFATAPDLGLFAAPYRVMFALIFAFSIISSSIYPTFAELHIKDLAAFARLLRYYRLSALAFGLTVGVGGTLLRDEITMLLFGPQYMQSAMALAILCWFVALTAIRRTYGILISVVGLQRLHVPASAVAVLLFVAFFTGLRGALDLPWLDSACLSLVGAEAGILATLIIIWNMKKTSVMGA